MTFLHPNMLAIRTIQRIRSSAAVPVPIRLVHHIPQFDTLIGPVNMFEALSITKKINYEGYREDEPITISEPIFHVDNSDLILPSYAIAGNHRLVGTRDALAHMVYAHVVTSADILHIYNAVKQMDEESNSRISPKQSVQDRLFRVLKFLVIMANTCSVSPKPYAPLHQAVLLRTLVYSDAGVPKPVSKDRKVYGGFEFLRERFFCGSQRGASDSHNRNHFLYNSSHSTRHLNRQPLGCMRLIETYLSHYIPYLGSTRSVLDILVLWENNHLMPEFKDTHIGSAGELSSSQLVKIIETCAEGLRKRNHMCADNGALLFAPLCTQFVKGVKCGRLIEAILKVTKYKGAGTKHAPRDRETKRKRHNREDISVPPNSTEIEREITAFPVPQLSSKKGSMSATISDDINIPSEAQRATKVQKVNQSDIDKLELHRVKDSLKGKERKEKYLLEEMGKLKEELRRLKSESTQRVSKSSGTRRLSSHSYTPQLEAMSREDLWAMKAEIERRLSSMK